MSPCHLHLLFSSGRGSGSRRPWGDTGPRFLTVSMEIPLSLASACPNYPILFNSALGGMLAHKSSPAAATFLSLASACTSKTTYCLPHSGKSRRSKRAGGVAKNDKSQLLCSSDFFRTSLLSIASTRPFTGQGGGSGRIGGGAGPQAVHQADSAGRPHLPHPPTRALALPERGGRAGFACSYYYKQ